MKLSYQGIQDKQGYAAAQVALGFVIQQHGAYLLPKAGGQVLQAALVLPHGTFAHARNFL